jgi:hypothetical protein
LVLSVWRERANQESVVIDKAVGLDDDLDHVMVDLAATLDLKWDVAAIGESVQDRVEATIKQRQKHVQGALRLLDELGPNLELKRLTRSQIVVAVRHHALAVASTS